MTSETVRASRYEAIEIAEREGLTLSKYADPVEGAREGLTVEEARLVAREDPGLIYLPALDHVLYAGRLRPIPPVGARVRYVVSWAPVAFGAVISGAFSAISGADLVAVRLGDGTEVHWAVNRIEMVAKSALSEPGALS